MDVFAFDPVEVGPAATSGADDSDTKFGIGGLRTGCGGCDHGGETEANEFSPGELLMRLVHIFSVFVANFGKHAVLLSLRKIAILKKI